MYHVLVLSIQGMSHNTLNFLVVAVLMYISKVVYFTCLGKSGDPSAIIIVIISKDLE